jgi:hypothetical protein
MYDVYLTCIDDDDEQVPHVQSGTGSKYREYNPGSELNVSFLMNNEQKN